MLSSLFSSLKEFAGKSVGFLGALAKDTRIPAWDKAVLAGFAALLVSPIDIIPDFIPLLGQLDDLAILVVILDYVFNRLPEEVVLAHYPWNPAGFKAWRRRMRFLSTLVPDWARKRIWRVGETSGPAAAPDPRSAGA
jgi:uncharacterized membrane protein YkvA (DUF1232 family)